MLKLQLTRLELAIFLKMTTVAGIFTAGIFTEKLRVRIKTLSRCIGSLAARVLAITRNLF